MKEISFFIPSFIRFETEEIKGKPFSFPAISITGDRCELNCSHCKGILLKRMLNGKYPEIFEEKVEELKRSGAVGILISGGSNLRGEVEFERFATSIKKAKRELNLKVVIHTGVLNRERTLILKECGVDAVMIDIPPSDEITRKIFHLPDRKPFFRTIEYLSASGLRFYPHIIAGFTPECLEAERKTCREITTYFQPSGLVAIFLTGIKGTDFENIPPPNMKEAIKFLECIRKTGVKTILGCKRPGGSFSENIEKTALEIGFDGIVFPRDTTVRYAKTVKKIEIYYTCCTAV